MPEYEMLERWAEQQFRITNAQADLPILNRRENLKIYFVRLSA